MDYQLIDSGFTLNSGRSYAIPKIKDLPSNERPREKMLERSVNVLNTAELLAIVLGVGTKNEEVLSMTTRLLKEYGEKGIAYLKDPNIMKDNLKLPLNKACQIIACSELGRRFYQKKSGKVMTIKTSKQAYTYLKDMGNLQKEQFRGLYLNTQYQLIHDEVISLGTLDAALIHPREVFKPALEYSAAAIIIAHNHPSGKIKASKVDLEITEKLVAAGKIFDIEILDHLIIGQRKFSSII